MDYVGFITNKTPSDILIAHGGSLRDLIRKHRRLPCTTPVGLTSGWPLTCHFQGRSGSARRSQAIKVVWDCYNIYCTLISAISMIPNYFLMKTEIYNKITQILSLSDWYVWVYSYKCVNLQVYKTDIFSAAVSFSWISFVKINLNYNKIKT